ncbi:outer membrane protein assembly factor BamE [Chitinivorax tropicus]|uniref:Outer membrane protein assembly factor BamE n=1 Tax=Chitinivorax tropicus TaxID=714531 RepID=A0A840MQ37_9PROT|nr:outer membrane protein assembly factor BamE [Chitinivorax tropicus]MBB5019199.1 outer membrane protein assembly factor BamE [Chitinivorax tropicus]
MQKLLSVLTASLLLSACSWLTPYKLDIQQGNYITEDMVAKLKPGMTRNQVRYVLGTPMLVDPFHANRWDYVYREVRDGKVVVEKRYVVNFEGDKATSFEGEVFPTQKGFIAAPAPQSAREQTLEQAGTAEAVNAQNDAKRANQ